MKKDYIIDFYDKYSNAGATIIFSCYNEDEARNTFYLNFPTYYEIISICIN